MKYIETDTIELKETLNVDFKKEVVAFANSFGGTIYLGINDEGEVIGLTNSKLVIEQIGGMIREGIKSDLSLFVRIKEEKIDGKDIVVVTVNEGSAKPYYIAEKGLKPTGVYLRLGSSSLPASDESIKMMLKEHRSSTFEDSISIDQQLELSDLKKRFAKAGIKLDSAKMKSFGLIGKGTDLYTNLAFLLSNKNTFTIKCAVYEDKTVSRFIDQKEFSGSLLSQFDEIQKYLYLINKTTGRIVGFKLMENKDYPNYALREALVNACVHRSFEFSGSVIVHIYSNRMEIVSLGGLVRGLTFEDALGGVSEKRNAKLAEIFRRLKYIEGYGTGIKRIIASYDDYDNKPEFKVTANTFTCALPNTNYQELKEEKVVKIEEQTKDKVLINYLEKYGSITRREVELLFNVGKSQAKNIISSYLKNGLIKAEGTSRGVKYLLSKNS